MKIIDLRGTRAGDGNVGVNALLEQLLERKNVSYTEQQKAVDEIITAVKERGDAALFEYTREFDGVDINAGNIRVTEKETDEAYAQVDEKLVGVIREAIARVRTFHEKQRQNSWFCAGTYGELLGQLVLPLQSCGIYVPGGKAAYPSTVIMNAVPAIVAGVERIVMVTPPKINPVALVTARELGITEIYRVGGAQAVAALAFGTASVPRVDKIVGPGNIYVALAKRAVYGHVNIDSVAGPSEILIVADESANPAFVAADLLSQAEHDEMASAILVTTSEALCREVTAQLEAQTARLSRKEIIKASMDGYGAVILVDDIRDAFHISNRIAPEHLEISTREPFNYLPLVKNAGAVFLGHYTPEPLGDYMAGPNHVLPTGGTARFFSPLSVDDFIKKSSVLSFPKEAAAALGGSVAKFALAEGLDGHAAAVTIRGES